MVFSSMRFICVFLPVTLVLYWLIPFILPRSVGEKMCPAARNALLLAASLLFYACGEGIYVLLLIICALANYMAGRILHTGDKDTASAAASGENFTRDPVQSERSRETPARRTLKARLVLTAAVVADLGILGFYKYAGMLVSTLNALSGLALPVPAPILPIGISFYTFQAMSYVIDVYRGKTSAERSFFRFLLYISFFPQLIAGPIVRYRDIAGQIRSRSADASRVASGLKRFSYGLAAKVLIANSAALAADRVFAMGASSLSLPLAWLGAAAYTIQIFFDFSGYSSMAIGLGRMFGFDIRENFRQPYSASSMQEFWRRWHISLTDWFREYLYIPLGGNRKGAFRTKLNRFAVFFCTGLWHGASWNFVLWGLFHGALTSAEVSVTSSAKNRPEPGAASSSKENRPVQGAGGPGGSAASPKKALWRRLAGHFYVLVSVTLGFVLFRADTLAGALRMYGAMFVPAAMTAERSIALGRAVNPMVISALVAGAVLAVLPEFRSGRADQAGAAAGTGSRLGDSRPAAGFIGLWSRAAEPAGFCVSLLLLILSMLSLTGGAYNPFIYFRF